MNLRQLLMLKAAGGEGPETRTVVGNPVSFRTKVAAAMEMEIPVEPVQEGSGDPSPQNVRSISGWTGANVNVAGKNCCPLPPEETKNGITLVRNADGSVTLTGTNGSGATYFDCISDFDSTKFAGYYLSAGYEGTNATVRMRFTQSDYTMILNIGSNARAITDNGKHCKITIRVAGNYAIPTGGVTLYPLLRKSDTSADFEPYKGTTYHIAFPSDAGTVYGGELTINRDGTGELVIDRKFYEFDGSSDEEWYVEGTGTYKFARTVVEPFRGRTDPAVCNEFVYGTIGNNTSDIGYDFNNTNHLRVRYALLTTLDVSEVRSYFAAHPLQIAYYIATPITYTLTTEQVMSLLGQNNVWADTNGQNKITYKVR